MVEGKLLFLLYSIKIVLLDPILANLLDSPIHSDASGFPLNRNNTVRN